VTTLLIIIHIIICFILIVAVLLQSGKSADLAGAFGGVGSQTVFGPRGAGSFLSKITTICAILFMITSFGLWLTSSKGTTKSVIKEKGQPKETVATTETKKESGEEKAQPQTQVPEKKQETEKKGTETEKKK